MCWVKSAKKSSGGRTIGLSSHRPTDPLFPKLLVGLFLSNKVVIAAHPIGGQVADATDFSTKSSSI